MYSEDKKNCYFLFKGYPFTKFKVIKKKPESMRGEG